MNSLFYFYLSCLRFCFIAGGGGRRGGGERRGGEEGEGGGAGRLRLALLDL